MNSPYEITTYVFYESCEWHAVPEFTLLEAVGQLVGTLRLYPTRSAPTGPSEKCTGLGAQPGICKGAGGAPGEQVPSGPRPHGEMMVQVGGEGESLENLSLPTGLPAGFPGPGSPTSLYPQIYECHRYK